MSAAFDAPLDLALEQFDRRLGELLGLRGIELRQAQVLARQRGATVARRRQRGRHDPGDREAQALTGVVEPPAGNSLHNPFISNDPHFSCDNGAILF